MANVDNPNGFRALQTTSGSKPQVLSGYTKTGVTLNPGDAIIVDGTTGLIDIATSSSTAIYGVCQSKVTGETGVSKRVNFIPASRDVIFEGQCSGTLTQATIGDTCDIEGTTGIMEINEDSTTTNVVRIIGLSDRPGNDLGANARVKFTFVGSQWA